MTRKIILLQNSGNDIRIQRFGRSGKIVQEESFVAKLRFDTAENELSRFEMLAIVAVLTNRL